MAEGETEATNESAGTQNTAKWLIGALAGVGTLLLSGVGLSNIGHLHGTRLCVAFLAFSVAVGAVLWAIYLITDILTPQRVCLADLAKFERNRNDNVKTEERNDALIKFIESDPSLLQGIVKSTGPTTSRLITANDMYLEALDDRFASAETYWKLINTRAKETAISEAKESAEVADGRTVTMHDTIRRLEGFCSEKQTLLSFAARKRHLRIAAGAVALGIFAFAFASNPPTPSVADLRGANLENVDLSGASLREANLEGMTIDGADFEGTDLEGAKIEGAVWKNTVCPDGTNSDNAGDTCAGHLSPRLEPDPLP